MSRPASVQRSRISLEAVEDDVVRLAGGEYRAVLEVGSVVESVEVKAEAALLETETSTTGHLATGEVVNKLPTPQQKMHHILFYMPGVTGQRGEGHGAGQRSRSFVMSMDGVSGMEPVRRAISTSTIKKVSTSRSSTRRVRYEPTPIAERYRPMVSENW